MPPDRSHSDYGQHYELTPCESRRSTNRSRSRWPKHPRWEPPHNGPFPRPPITPGGERRRASWRSGCSIKVKERLWRVMNQSLYNLAEATVVTASHWEFVVSGNTYYVYKVVINQLPSCSCPDWGNGYVCKHILFVFLKVLNVPPESSLYFQKALLTEELEDIFSKAPEIKYPDDPTARRLWNTYAAKMHEFQTEASEEITSKKRPIEEGDECPICYDDLPCNSTQGLVFCVNGCGKALHEHCVQDYVKNLKSAGKKVNCVYCRADWKMSGSNVAGTNQGGFLNLGRDAGLGYVYHARYAAS